MRREENEADRGSEMGSSSVYSCIQKGYYPVALAVHTEPAVCRRAQNGLSDRNHAMRVTLTAAG